MGSEMCIRDRFYELAENRMPLLGMEKKTGSLEDIFLQLTDKPEEETKQ